MVRLTLASCLFVTAVGCGSPATPPQPAQAPSAPAPEPVPGPRTAEPGGQSPGSLKARAPEIVTTPGQIAKDWKDDDGAAGKKYQGKVVEINGSVLNVSQRDPPGSGKLIVVDADATDNLAASESLVACSFVPGDAVKYQNLEALARGQRVKVRGIGSDQLRSSLIECEFLQVGPTTAIPCTVSEIHAAFAKSPAEAAQKYLGRALVCRVQVSQADPNILANNCGRWRVTDVGGDGKEYLEAFIPYQDAERLKRFAAVALGQTVILLGETDSMAAPLRLTEIRVLKEPPEGVELPGEGK
jgi:hypothetical protein